MNILNKKMLPIGLAVLSILLFVLMIARHEWHLANSQSIYVKLQPVDPRSLIQGDYMALNYQLYFGGQPSEEQSANRQTAKVNDAENLHRDYFVDQKSIVSYVQLDAQR